MILVRNGTTAVLTGRSHLKESLQPPDLENSLTNEDNELEDTPPLDAGISALGRVPVCSLADNDIALLILDLRDKFCHLADYETVSMRPWSRIAPVHIPSFSKGS